MNNSKRCKNRKTFFIFLVSILVVISAVNIFFAIRRHEVGKARCELTTNEQFIENLQSPLNVNDKMEVFEYIFSRLDEEVTVYPTENYYYFKAPANGLIITGSILLSPNLREQHKIQFFYEFSRENISDARTTVVLAELGEENKVYVQKISDFSYSVKYSNKKVKFTLNKLSFSPPKNLLPGEVYVAPVFDESGVQFHLVFNEVVSRLYFLLNENGPITELLLDYKEGVLFGKRTGFAFFNDKKNDRKVLIGVMKKNVLINNWYDGPFDQMPDNFIATGQVSLVPYLEKHFGKKLNADKYGWQKGRKIKTIVPPILPYWDKKELLFVKECKSRDYNIHEFYFCLTMEKKNKIDLRKM
ncbi:hypothetical protein ACFLRA_02215 [Bdellovibrionota bacterium]